MNESTEVNCPICGVEVPPERKELLGVETCVKCTPQRPKPKGVMEYGSKNCGVLAITDNKKVFRYLKKPANLRR
jgi:hypothetical protein